MTSATRAKKATSNGKTAKAATVEVEPAPIIQISRIQAETILVPVIGTSELIMHNWSEKARRIMLETQQGKKTPKEPRDPEADYKAAFYRIASAPGQPERYGMPVTAFKQCTVSAARFYGKSVTMTALQQCLFFHGEMTPADRQELIEITGEPRMREDMVGVGVSGTDLRYRPGFQEWSAVLSVTFVKSMVDRGSVLSLIDAGGMGVGVGDWRPEKRGTFGCFMVDQTREVQVLNNG
jgi:hypothetical protein